MSEIEAQSAEAVAEQTQETPSGLSLLDQIADNTGYSRKDEDHAKAKAAVGDLIKMITESDKTKEKDFKLRASIIDELVAEIDKKISDQIDQVLHHENFQKLESAWTGLKYVVDNTDFRENIKIDLLNVSKEDLATDFEDQPEVALSGLFHQVHSSEYGQFGGEPYGAIIGNYDFGPSQYDVALLRNIASVSEASHAPFIAAASTKFFGKNIKDFRDLAQLKDVEAIFENDQYNSWNSFRQSEASRYVCLTLPKFLLRSPYHPEENPVKGFNYEEADLVEHDHYLWGNTAFAFAARLTDSFAQYRWCANIIGPRGGGAVLNLPQHHYEVDGKSLSKVPTELKITEALELKLSELGFIGLTYRKDSDNAAFFSANSAQKPKTFPNTEEGKMAETNYKLGGQLPYLMIACRIAHYIKVQQVENIGSYIERRDLERELDRWIKQYVSDSDNPPKATRMKHPLRKAHIAVAEVPGEPGWYKTEIQIRPHLKFMGGYFDLSLVGSINTLED